jgi:uroporphyrinogen-III synthase
MWLVCSIDIPDFIKEKKHIPFSLIETKKESFDETSLQEAIAWSDCIIISSKQTIRFLKKHLDQMAQKTLLVTGESTWKSLPHKLQKKAFFGPSEDQEGIFSLIKKLKPQKIFYPHAKKIRAYLIDQIKKENIPLKELVCYRTDFLKKTYPKEEISSIYFGSSSQALSFIEQFGPSFPFQEIVVSGHVTQDFVEKIFENTRVLTKKEWLEKNINFC